ncbi:hypothetical protein NCAS_0A01520 [Naumovozyma castellii]|uniref:CSC1/OSCA1-like 7TM region domain-containing protein n=1 Tax=Naumovozyma castellii TaxID=27288 RepID=G0V5H4_NAUCA|nr:hypothetical protein NCAS_0A01520 [Naumovozyma castellii CBS 4309]CCC66710.1 hypothetical protein NCAS_0A01520 [Naumovozyma castellii CBS 4309]
MTETIESNVNISTYLQSYLAAQNEHATQLMLKFTPEENTFESSFRNITENMFFKLLNTTRTGSAHHHVGISLQRFLSGILVSVLFFFFQLLIFLLLRTKLKTIYQANKVLEENSSDGNEDHSSSFGRHFSWIKDIFLSPIEKYKDKAGIDGYFFLRFLRFLMLLFFILSFVNIPFLVPVHLLAENLKLDSQTGDDNQFKPHLLDRLNMSNIIPPSEPNILIIHLVICIFVIIWFHIMLKSELRYGVSVSMKEIMRNKYQTVLYVDNVPRDMNKIVEYFSLIGQIMDVQFVPKDYKKCHNIWKRLCSIEEKLEIISMEIILEKIFEKSRPKTLKYFKFHFNKLIFRLKTCRRLLNVTFSLHWGNRDGGLLHYLPELKVTKVPFLEERYIAFEETLEHYRRMADKWDDNYYGLETAHQELIGTSSHSKSYFKKVFINFDSVKTAHIFGQLLLSHHNDEWNNIIIGPNPRDIKWGNLALKSPYVMFFRSILASLLGTLTIVGWILPVVTIGLISQLPFFNSPIPLPKFFSKNSEFVQDMVMSVFSVMTLVFLTEFVPFIFEWFSHLRACKTGAAIQIDIQNWFFVFLFVHIFLVLTISSGISFVIESLLNNPVSIPTLLAHDLPKSSNFFCSFILMRGIAYAGGNIIRVKELLIELLYYRPFMYTPHKRYERLTRSLSFQWGTIYPIFSVLGCIGLIYSVIAPIILPLCCVSFSFVYFSFKYLFEFQYNEENKSETFGKLYSHALMELYTGLYCMEFCVMGIFAISNAYKLSFCLFIIVIMTVITQYKISTVYLSRWNQLPLYYIKENQSLESRDLAETDYNDARCNLKEFEIPLIDTKKKHDEIWLLNNDQGIGEEEQEHLEKHYDVACNCDKFSVDKLGNVYLNDK